MLKKALLALAALAVLDVLLSLTAARDGRILDVPLPPFGATTHPRQEQWLASLEAHDDSKRQGRFDVELGWTWRTSSVSDDGRFRVNSLGARSEREYERRPAPGVLRILTFGDSFVYGDEIPERATFQSILEGRSEGWEVLNFGVSGYGTDQALLRFRRAAPDLGAEVVVLGLLFENIGRNVNRYRPLWNPKTGFCATKPRFRLTDGGLELVPQPFASASELAHAVRDGSVIEAIRRHEYWLDRPAVPGGRLSSLARLACVPAAHASRRVATLWNEPEGEPFRVTLALLESFQDEARELGARLAPVLLFPAATDLELAHRGRPYWNALVGELDRRGIAHLDLVTPLARRYAELAEEGREKTLYSGYHLSSVANSVVADELERWIVERLR